MNATSLKKRNARRWIPVLSCILLYLALISFLAGLFSLSANYQKVYDSPTVIDGIADYEGHQFEGRKVASNLAGEWEFFYNRWIITDGEEDAVPDGYLSVPGHWTMKDFGSGTLPRQGYASYRMTLYHVPEGHDVTVYRINSNVAMRAYVNGELVSSTGTLSKRVSGTVVTGTQEVSFGYHTNGEPLVIVVEISATESGGLIAAPWMSRYHSTDINYWSGWRNFSAAALGIATVTIALSLLTYIFFRHKRDFAMPALMAALYVHFLFSKDMLYFLGVPYGIAVIVEAISAAAIVVAMIWHLYMAGVRLPWRLNAVMVGTSAVMTAAGCALFGTDLILIPILALIAIGCVYVWPIVSERKLPPAMRGVYGVLFIFLISILSFEAFDFFGLIVFGTEFIFSVEIMLVIACFAVLALWRMAVATRAALRAGELEQELMRVKQQALKAQIKPHFIFNSLTAIQSLYHSDLCAGDEALERFARHLRLNIDSDGADTIPFEDEIHNILNYFELENLRTGGVLTLLLDINYTDFAVPVLSLQPLVENAIRYAGTEKRKDGYIQLSSMRIADMVIVKVVDNGKGFDVDEEKFGVGLHNARERFEMMGANMTVTSREGDGTEIAIIIPVEEV